MKTPTLIVRLIGLYLLVTCSFTLFQLQRVQAMNRGMPSLPQNGFLDGMQAYAIAGLLVGLAATLFAGPLARMLTFDSETKQPGGDFSDRFIGR